jgi:hypothetical protein
VATGTNGTACEANQGPWCAPPLFCAQTPTDAGVTPSSGSSCRPQYTAGGPCHTGYPDACPDDYFCETATAFTGVCNQRRAAGATCTIDQVCQIGHDCLGRSLNTTGTCVVMKNNGETCLGNSQCYSGFCNKGKCSIDNPSCP